MPIRRFELPAETVGTLKAQIELQKQAVQATSAKVDNMKMKSGQGFYPLPEGMHYTACKNIVHAYSYIHTCTCIYIC